MGEFRTDVLWTALWLAALAILTSNGLNGRKLFWTGFLLGAALCVSLKTIFLLVLLLLAGGITWLVQRPPVSWRGLALAAAGMAILPICLVSWFAARGALGPMYYCLVTHNTLPDTTFGAELWARLSSARSLLFLAALAPIGCFHSSRRLFLFLIAALYYPLLHLLWPTITPQDYLPWFPVLFACAWPPLFDLRPGIPAAALLLVAELVWMQHQHPVWRNENAANVEEIRAALRLTHPGEYLMDAKGDCIFRPRPYWFVLETFTRKRLEHHLLADDLPERLTVTGTAVVDESPRMSSRSLEFIHRNYLSVGPLSVLGQMLPADAGGERTFEVVIPQIYAFATPAGPVTAATLDGTPLTGPRWLSAGLHTLRLADPSPQVAFVWNHALRRGYSPFGETFE
jgi:hypothetical protein